MPALQQIAVTPTSFRSGDHVTYDGEVRIVEEVKIGRSRATVKDTSGRTFYVPLDAGDISIQRLLPTEAEKAQAKAERLEEGLETVLKNLRQAAETDPVAVFAEKMATYSDPLQGLSWYADDLFLSAAHHKFAAKVVAVADRQEWSSRQTVGWAIQEAEKEIRQNARHFGSRSTSWASNAAEDAQRAAAATWLESFEVTWVSSMLAS